MKEKKDPDCLFMEFKMRTSEWSFTPFKGLKKVIESNKNTVIKKDTIKDKTDEEIFIEAMADVREIREFREIPIKEPPRIKRPEGYRRLLYRADDSLEILRQIVSGERKIRLSDTGEYMEWISPNMRKDITQRLHQGDFSVQDYIDLHGMTLGEAEEALCLFFREAIKKATVLCKGDTRTRAQVSRRTCS
jgi:DNA-nicking Smr family endonuclease